MLRSTLPAPATDGDRNGPQVSTDASGPAAHPDRPAAQAAPPAPVADLWREVRSADDSDRGWGRDDAPPDDDRILREKPPHW